MTATILLGAGCALLIAVLAWALSARPEKTTTWICTSCLYESNSYADAQVHVQAAHPRSAFR